MASKLYPIGIQTFGEIIRRGFFYVDKTAYVYKVTHSAGKYIFLSRPRRFGKSLLLSTFKSYFEGRKELFKGLAIEQLESEWTACPVLHFDMSTAKHCNVDELLSELNLKLLQYEAIYGTGKGEEHPNQRLMGVVERAFKQTGHQVVVLIDEYDAPLLDVMHEDAALSELRNVMRNFYSPLKYLDPMLRFVFITGITKFSQLSIFSELNNLNNISMLPEYAGICGITKDELETQMRQDVQRLGERIGRSCDETLEALRMNYDGYHFAWPSPDVFNPFSLISALANGKIKPYWFSSGTPTYLLEMLRKFDVLPDGIAEMPVKESAFDAPTENMKSITPLLYQSGYVTIKDYDAEMELYTLGIPNREICVGLYESLLPNYLGYYSEKGDVTISYMSKYIREDNMGRALELLQQFLSTVPYCNVLNREGHYQQMLYVIFTLLTPFMVDVEVRTQHGRVDVVLTTKTHIYVMELKLNRDAATALHQIDEKGYAQRFAMSRLPVRKVGVNFDATTGNITDWVIA